MKKADPVDAIAMAVLYEGYLLYPYSHSALKNQVRWTFGGVHPRCWSEANGGFEPWAMQAQCLVVGEPSGARLAVTVRFLHLLERRTAADTPWQEATERSLGAGELELASVLREPVRLPVELPASLSKVEGVTREWWPVRGEAAISAEPAAPGATRVTVRVVNRTPLADPAGLPRERAMLHAMASTHAVLRLTGARFVSLADPPPELREAAAACQNVGAWPVLVGEPGATDTMLASPIILEDYPRVAEESPQDLFDGAEIDELLTLSVLTLTDEEKERMRRGDERARRLLERAESLSTDELIRLHGTIRCLRPISPEQTP